MTISLLLSFAAGFLSSLRLGPLIVIPLALTSALAVLLSGLKIIGSAALAVVCVVAAVNLGYLFGAVTGWIRGRPEGSRSIFSARRFMR